ncbi:MAG: hypothetical protein IPP57_09450 [Candidatus Obscuribacter sp.]|nr:hypothetical protein [Candidatus Obscuribacter sp.]MBK9622287.1 hypothetical protein [Candidatus Obscuribacter sp.]MBK9771034.1 hypothetical protein [Candidatus Obscuribacter sp.]MDQ5966145.1 hypothetical protein [Cyanobacteriota bacterium erpe_2018_sw_39hr_WHONDRS-SW48-000098_B_bin.30]
MSTMLIHGYSQHIAHKTLISQDQKNRIQELLSQMFNAITPRTEIDSPVYAWFPEGESTTEMEAISIDDSDPADRAVAQVMVEVNSNIELEAAPSLSAAPLRNFKSMVRELAGTSEEAEINRIPVKTAITGDIVALKCDNSIARTGLVIADSCGQLVVHSKDAQGWCRVPLQIHHNRGEILAAYRVS